MRRFFLALLTTALPFGSFAVADGVVNVYSYRQPPLVEPLFKAFTAKTGITVKMIFAEKGLLERLEQEGPLSPADVLLSSDVGRLVEAAAKGLAQPVVSDAINSKIPANLRANDNQWFGLTMRARVVYDPMTACRRLPFHTRNWPMPNGKARFAPAHLIILTVWA